MSVRNRIVAPPRLLLGEYATRGDRVSPVRLCGLDIEVAGRQWEVPPELERALLTDLCRPDTFERRQAACVVGADHRIIDKEKKYRHYWLQTDRQGLPRAATVIGPACAGCVANLAMSAYEDSTGRTTPMYVYEVTFGAPLKKWLAQEGYDLPPGPETSSENAVHHMWGSRPLF